MRTVLITGGGGFLAAHLARRLRSEGDRVVLLDVAFPPSEENDLSARLVGDVADSTLLEEVVGRESVTHIVHLAALLTSASSESLTRAASVNCVGTASVVEVALRTGVRRVLLASSVAVFGDGRQRVSDDEPPMPTGVYGATKAFAEHLAVAVRTERGADVSCLRFGWIYGPGRMRGWSELQHVIEDFALERCPVRVPHFQSANDWTYVSDAAEAIVLALRCERLSKAAYNVPGFLATVAEAVDHLRSRFPAARVEWYPAVLPPVGWSFGLDAAHHDFGYEPSVDLPKGLDLTVEALRRAHGLSERPAAAPAGDAA